MPSNALHAPGRTVGAWLIDGVTVELSLPNPVAHENSFGWLRLKI
jgi:hypothetical protein